MDWILKNLQLVFVLVLLGAYVLRAIMQRREAGEDPARPGQTGEADHEDGDRTRRIQDEIRRRILERQQRSAPQREEGPVIIFDEETLRPEVIRPPLLDHRLDGPPPIPQIPREDPELAAVLDRQRSLEEQMQALRARRAYVIESARPLVSPAGARGPVSTASGRTFRRELRREIGGVRSLRRAVLLREILGDPPGLRPGGNRIPRQ